MAHRRIETTEVLAVGESWGALVIGGTLGATTFLLCALLLGTKTAIAISAVAMVAALVRRMPTAAIAFAAAAALALAEFISTSAVLVGAAAAFGVALTVFARGRTREEFEVMEAASRID